jgi:thioredoxin-like negative regulator of GroEL
MSIVALATNNFRVQGKTLAVNFGEPMLILFKMDSCPACTGFEPVFVQLAKEERRVAYGVVNISSDSQVAKMSRNTTTPVSSVPFLLLYKDGRPIAKFTGKRNIPSIKSFIEKALKSVPPSQQSFAQPRSQEKIVDNFRNRGQPTGQAPSKYMHLGVEEEDEMRMLAPDQVTPYNAPWEAYKKLGGD